MMLDSYIESIATSPYTLRSGSDIDLYFDYIIYKLNEDISSIDIVSPQLKIINSPHYESCILECNDKSTIIFDVNTVLLIEDINNIILRGDVTKFSLLSLLKAGANALLTADYPNVALSLALNINWIDEFISPFKSVLKIKDDFWDDLGDRTANTKCQEMFILAHEVTHYYISKKIYRLSTVTRHIFDNYIKQGKGSSSTRFFFGRVFGKFSIKNDNERSIYKLMRKELFSTVFREEILCDLVAADLTIEYFAWDSGSMKDEDIYLSIQATLHSLLLFNSLKNHLIPRNKEPFNNRRKFLARFLLRIKVMDAVFSEKIKKQAMWGRANFNRAVERITDFSVIHDTHLRKRTTIIEQCLFPQLLKTIQELDNVYHLISPHLTNPRIAAFFYLGYYNKETNSTDFLKQDGSIFRRNSGVCEELKEKAKVDLFDLKEFNVKKAQDVMESIIF